MSYNTMWKRCAVVLAEPPVDVLMSHTIHTIANLPGDLEALNNSR